MAKFIELHYQDGESVLVNLDKIALILESEDGSVLHLAVHPESPRRVLHVRESYLSIRKELIH